MRRLMRQLLVIKLVKAIEEKIFLTLTSDKVWINFCFKVE